MCLVKYSSGYSALWKNARDGMTRWNFYALGPINLKTGWILWYQSWKWNKKACKGKPQRVKTVNIAFNREDSTIMEETVNGRIRWNVSTNHIGKT